MNSNSPSHLIQTAQLELADEKLLAICDVASVVACKCPSHLAKLLRDVRRFRRYTAACIKQFPEDTDTHQWLTDKAAHIEFLLSQIIVELLERDGLLDEYQQLDLRTLAQQNYLKVTKQNELMS